MNRAVYDIGRGTLVSFVGRVGRPETPDSDTWQWSSGSWQRFVGPVGRAASHMVFDGRRKELVLFGGQGAAPAAGQPQSVFGDTWLWNGRAWRQASLAGPPPRSFHG